MLSAVLLTAVQLILTSVQIGAVYILFSLGLTLIFGIMRIVNFAHGHFFAISALLVSLVVPHLAGMGMPVLPAYLLGIGIGIGAALVLGYVVYTFGIRFFLRDTEGAFILTTGLGLFLDGVLLGTFGGAVRGMPKIIGGTVPVLGVALTLQRLVLCVAAVLVTALLYWAMAFTRLGKAMRAVAADHEAAMLQGIPYRRLALTGFLLAAALAALSGALIAPVSIVSPFMGSDYLVKGFMAVIVGGLGSVPGAILGALFIALVETVGGFYLDASSATVAIFVLVIILLLLRPRGLVARA